MKKIIASLVLVLLLCSGCTEQNNSGESSFQIYYFSVGHGDAALVMCDGHNMMIDCGSSNTSGDNDLYLLDNYLQELGIEEFDYIVCSHPDKDHYSKFKDLLEGRKVNKKVLCSTTSDVVNKSEFNAFENSFKTLFKKITVPKVNDKYELGSATIDILAVNTKKYSSNSNDSSIVLMITYGNNKFLFTGDAGRTTENEMLNNNKNVKCDVLKVAHHGSYTASSDKFLNAANPEYAIFSVCSDDIIDSGILDTLEGLGTKSFRTDEKGTIICTSNGKKITLTNHNGAVLAE